MPLLRHRASPELGSCGAASGAAPQSAHATGVTVISLNRTSTEEVALPDR